MSYTVTSECIGQSACAAVYDLGKGPRVRLDARQGYEGMTFTVEAWKAFITDVKAGKFDLETS